MTRLQLMASVLAALLVSAQAAPTVTLQALERLTPAQLQRLSQDQIDAIMQTQADLAIGKLLIATMKIDEFHPGPMWPDSDNTMHFAAEIGYDGWSDGTYKKDPGPDLRSSGCVFQVAAAYQKAFADKACRHQNYGYRNVPQYRYTHNEAARQAIDIRFLMDMYTQCLNETQSGASQYACKLAAVAAYVQARKNGKAVFDAITARYP
jgi:Prokaryotic phospholipase A2